MTGAVEFVEDKTVGLQMSKDQCGATWNNMPVALSDPLSLAPHVASSLHKIIWVWLWLLSKRKKGLTPRKDSTNLSVCLFFSQSLDLLVFMGKTL